MAKTVKGPRKRPSWSYRETGTGLRTRKYPYTPSGSYTVPGKRGTPAEELNTRIRVGIRRTRNVAGVSEVGRKLGRGIRARKSRMPRR